MMMHMEPGMRAELDVTPDSLRDNRIRMGPMFRLLADALDEVKLPTATRVRLDFGLQKICVEVLMVQEIKIEELRILRDKLRDALDRRIEVFLTEKYGDDKG